MNLGNNQFYDNVQQCYYVRRSLMKVMADAPMFRRPANKKDYEDFLNELPPAAVDYHGVPLPEIRREMMKQNFTHGSTMLYIKRYFLRKNAYKGVVYELERLNRENKLLMDITDEDIEKYIKQNSKNVSQQAMADLIIGTWLVDEDTIVFHADNTLERTWVMEIQSSILLSKEQTEVLMLLNDLPHERALGTEKGDFH